MEERVTAALGRSQPAVLMVWALLAASAPAGASIIRGDFSGIVDIAGAPFAGPVGSNFQGHYTYDDTGLPVGIVPFPVFEGTAYPALEFVIDGVPFDPSLIGLADGAFGGGADALFVMQPDGFPILQMVAPNSTWSGESLSVLSGLTFADFSWSSSSNLVATDFGGFEARGHVTAWQQSVVPEPRSRLLLGLGLAVLARRRAKARAPFGPASAAASVRNGRWCT